MNAASLNNKLDSLLRETKGLEEKVAKISLSIESLSAPGPATLSPPPAPHSASKGFLRETAYPFLKDVLAIILALLGLIGGFATYVALRFDVTVLPYVSLDPSSPHETRFLVTNQSPFAITDIFYVCNVLPPNQKEPVRIFRTIAEGGVPGLRSHDSVTTYCKPQQHPPESLKEGTFMDLEVMYHPWFFRWVPIRGGALFLLKYDHQGNAVWLPTGGMTSTAEELEKFSCATCKNHPADGETTR